MGRSQIVDPSVARAVAPYTLHVADDVLCAGLRITLRYVPRGGWGGPYSVSYGVPGLYLAWDEATFEAVLDVLKLLRRAQEDFFSDGGPTEADRRADEERRAETRELEQWCVV